MSRALGPGQQFRADTLVALSDACRDRRVDASRIAFDGDRITITTATGDVAIERSERLSGVDALREVGMRDASSRPAASSDGEDQWSELLYDLGANLDLLEATYRGLAYESIERDGQRARVRLRRASSTYEFSVPLD